MANMFDTIPMAWSLMPGGTKLSAQILAPESARVPAVPEACPEAYQDGKITSEEDWSNTAPRDHI